MPILLLREISMFFNEFRQPTKQFEYSRQVVKRRQDDIIRNGTEKKRQRGWIIPKSVHQIDYIFQTAFLISLLPESTGQLIVKNDHLQISKIPFAHPLLIYDRNQLQNALTSRHLDQFLLIVRTGQGNSHRQQWKGGVSVVAEEFDERTVTMTNFQDDSFEQLDVVLNCLNCLSEGIEALEKVIVQGSLRKNEDKIVLLGGIRQQQIEDLQQCNSRDVSCLLPK